MPNYLKTLCSWEIEILPEGSRNIRNGLAELLKKVGFKKDGDWNDGVFTVSSDFSEGNPYDTLKIYFMAGDIINTPLSR